MATTTQQRLETENKNLKLKVAKLENELAAIKVEKQKVKKEIALEKLCLKIPTSFGTMLIFRKAYEGIMRRKDIEIISVMPYEGYLEIQYNVIDTGKIGVMQLNNLEGKKL